MFREITADKITLTPYEIFKTQAALLTAKGEELGCMTIGWGTIGFLWGKQVATIYARPTRHTYKATEEAEYFSMCCFGKYGKELAYLGTASGHNENKIEKVGYTLVEDLAPYYKEAELVIICKKIYTQDLDESLFLDTSIIDSYYTKGEDKGNFHKMYVGEIVKVLVKE